MVDGIMNIKEMLSWLCSVASSWKVSKCNFSEVRSFYKYVFYFIYWNKRNRQNKGSENKTIS